MANGSSKRIFKVQFLNNGRVYEIYARDIAHGDLFGFVEVRGLLFGEKTQLVIDPAEESLQREFAGVERTFIPLHSVVRIDEVEKRGTATIHKVPSEGARATPAPVAYVPPSKG